jgi:hypothetical protein
LRFKFFQAQKVSSRSFENDHYLVLSSAPCEVILFSRKLCGEALVTKFVKALCVCVCVDVEVTAATSVQPATRSRRQKVVYGVIRHCTSKHTHVQKIVASIPNLAARYFAIIFMLISVIIVVVFID